ncbi:MAG: AtpZ/AtpI family protein [Myxococcota bacterium]
MADSILSENAPPKPPRRGLWRLSPMASMDGASLRTLGHFGSVGFEMAIFVVLGVKAGAWADERYGTKGFALLGLALGLFAGFRSLYQLAKKLRAREGGDA